MTLCSCMSAKAGRDYPQYPTDWPSLEIVVTEQCPNIEGLYAELAIEQTQCHTGQDDDNECWYLSYNLFPHHIGYKHVYLGPEWINSPRDASNSFIEVKQPNDNEIEVVVWYKDHKTKRIVTQHKFSKSDNEFSCDSSGIRIEDTEFFTMLIGTTAGKRVKHFMLNENNDLVMKSYKKWGGYYWIFADSFNETIWVRWPRIDKEYIESLN